jgi:hypothetical protein
VKIQITATWLVVLGVLQAPVAAQTGHRGSRLIITTCNIAGWVGISSGCSVYRRLAGTLRPPTEFHCHAQKRTGKVAHVSDHIAVEGVDCFEIVFHRSRCPAYNFSMH